MKSETPNQHPPAGVAQSIRGTSPFTIHFSPAVKYLGLVDYIPTWQAMKEFTANRNANTCDEIWLLQHPPVYTQGLAGKPEHLLCANDIPVVKIDRGGQITYHGPGQIIAYLLLDLRRWKINVRELVRLMEQAVIDLLAQYGVKAQGREEAPGVYVNNAKIASLGLKIKNGCCYHGIALNLDMDLVPFSFINPCGFVGLRVIQARDVGIRAPLKEMESRLANNMVELLHQHLHEINRVPGS